MSPMIWVEPYYRLRLGRLESVRGHWRKNPSRKLTAPVSLPNTSLA